MTALRVRYFALISVVFAVLIGAPALAGTDVDSRKGDNWISFVWNNDEKEVSDASSSRVIRANARIEILTGLRNRPGRVRMRAVLTNVSERELRIDGRLVHSVWDAEDNLERRLRSRVIDVVLQPGESRGARFRYQLPSGDYTARTDFRSS